MIAYNFFNIFAAENEIANTATIYYQEDGVDKSAQSNTVITAVLSPSPTPTSSPTPSPTTSPVSCELNLTLQGRVDYSTAGTTLEIYLPGQASPIFKKNDISTDNDGYAFFSIAVDLGTYDFRLKVGTYLAKTLTNQTLTDGLSLAFEQLKAGDLNDDTIVDVGDWAVMSGRWRSTQGGVSDINADGIVDVGDWSIMSSNWRQRDN